MQIAETVGTAVVGTIGRSSSATSADVELIDLIAQRDKCAMRALFTRYQLRVYRFALRLVGDATTAEDLMSEVFLTVWRRADQFQGHCAVATWLLAITRNLAFSMLRRRPMQNLEEETAALLPDDRDSPEVALQIKQRNKFLAHCLTKLSPAHREIIDLVYYHGKSINDVAAITCIPASTVKTRMFYARKHIAELLKEFEVAREHPKHKKDDANIITLPRRLEGCVGR
jgi:RNA polymerase sigma-70 factor (ECF subfamily)